MMWLIRIWRGWFGPDPVAGQGWELDSGDVVLVRHVSAGSGDSYHTSAARYGIVMYVFEDGSEYQMVTSVLKRNGKPSRRPRYFPVGEDE